MTSGDEALQRDVSVHHRGRPTTAVRAERKHSEVIVASVGFITGIAIAIFQFIPSLRVHLTPPEIYALPFLGLAIIWYSVIGLINPARDRQKAGRPLFAVIAIYVVIAFAAKLAAGGENAIISNIYVMWLPAVIAFGGLIIPFTTLRRLSWSIYGAFGAATLTWIFMGADGGELSHLTQEIQITAFLSLAALLLLLGEIASSLDAAVKEATLAREAAERANLAKSEFLARMSHDLRTPLNVVIGYSEVITGEVLGGREAWPRYRDYANDIRNSGQFLLAIVNDILDIARIESGGFTLKLEPVDVDAVVAETVSRLSQIATRDGVALVGTSGGEAGTIMADRRALEQVLQNLVANAIKFTPAGNRAGVRLSRGADIVSIEVWDEGVGIDAAEIPHLGEPFRRIGRADVADRPGTGLGIAIVQNLVRLHGGSLRFESAVGLGTTACVILPARPAGAPAG